MTDIAHRPNIPQPTARFRGTDSDLQTLRAELEQHRRFRIEQLGKLTASIPTEAPTWTDDPQTAVTLALRAAATAVLANIDDALFRIKDNRYGLCQGCGTAISLERLQALPMISLCRPCQHAKEVTSGIPVESRPPGCTPAALDIVDEWGHGSFPASDPPANW